MEKSTPKQSKKDWDDDIDETETIYTFPFPETAADKNPLSGNLSMILSNPIKMPKKNAKTKRTYSKMSLRPIISFGEIEKPKIDSHCKKSPSAGRRNKSTGRKAKVSSPLLDKESENKVSLQKTEPVYGIDLNMTHGSSELFISKFAEEKHDKVNKIGKNSVKRELNVGYQRTRKNLKRKIEEEKSISNDISTSEPSCKKIADKQKKSDELKIGLEENSEESNNYCNSSYQPPPLVQNNTFMDLIERYLKLKKANPKEEDEIEPDKPVEKSNSDKKRGRVSKKSPVEKKPPLSPLINQQKSRELHKEFKCEKSIFAEIQVENNGSSNLIPSNKVFSHVKDSTVNSSKEKKISFNFGDIKSDASFSGKNMSQGSALCGPDSLFPNQNLAAVSGLSSGSSFNTNQMFQQGGATVSQEKMQFLQSVSSHVQGTSTENSVYTVKSIISQETIGQTSEPDFEVQHQTRSLQSADFLCAYMDELGAIKNGNVSESDDETTPTGDMTVRQFYSIPNVNDAYSEILSGFSELDDLSQPNLCFEFPTDFLDKSHSQMVSDYVDWLMKKMITCKIQLKDSLFSSKYILNFAYQHMSHRECAIMSMVFNDPEEQLSISEITSKLLFVGMVVIFNTFVKEACSY